MLLFLVADLKRTNLILKKTEILVLLKCLFFCEPFHSVVCRSWWSQIPWILAVLDAVLEFWSFSKITEAIVFMTTDR